MPSAVEFAGVSKVFGGHSVLAGLDLAVAPGEKVTLIGPSGSGKTTVLRLAMALEKPSSGHIRVFGESLLSDGNEARLRRRCGMVFQQFNLFPHLTVMENLTLAPSTVLRLPAGQCREDALR